jgi:hypothetical protein
MWEFSVFSVVGTGFKLVMLGQLGRQEAFTREMPRLFILSRNMDCVSFFLAVVGFELRTLLLLGRCSYHLSYVPLPSPFRFVFFFWVSRLCVSQPGPRSSYLHFLHSWDDRHMPPHPAFIS